MTEVSPSRILQPNNGDQDSQKVPTRAGTLKHRRRRLGLRQTCGFKVNISTGVILKHRQTNERRYFRPSRNSSLLWSTPNLCVLTYSDFLSLKSEIETCDPVTWFGLNNFPNSKWQFEKMMNCTFYVTRLISVTIGQTDNKFPSYLSTNRAL